MNTLHSGIVFLIAAVIFHLLGRGITTATGGHATAAPLALLALCVSCVTGALGLYRLIAGFLAQRMRPSLPFTLDRPLPGLLRYQRGEYTMLIPLALDGRVPRLYEAAIGRWEAPHAQQPVSGAERTAILHDIILYLAERNEEIEIVREEAAVCAA